MIPAMLRTPSTAPNVAVTAAGERLDGGAVGDVQLLECVAVARLRERPGLLETGLVVVDAVDLGALREELQRHLAGHCPRRRR